jgi:hypothetical protein
MYLFLDFSFVFVGKYAHLALFDSLLLIFLHQFSVLSVEDLSFLSFL